MDDFLNFVYFVVIIIAIYQMRLNRKKIIKKSNEEAIERHLKIKELYESSLKSGNKKFALECGRIYYASLRGGTLSIYDEAALTNDLATMDVIDNEMIKPKIAPKETVH